MTVIDDDRKVARQLIYDAVLEIRFLASQANQDPESYPREETLERIRFLADLVHNLPFITGGPSKPAKVPRHEQPQRRRAQALEARPMTWAWLTAGPQGQDWITKHLDAAEVQWSAPPPLPTSRRGIPELTTRQRIGLLTGWPVRTPTQAQAAPSRSAGSQGPGYRGVSRALPGGQPPKARLGRLHPVASSARRPRCHPLHRP